MASGDHTNNISIIKPLAEAKKFLLTKNVTATGVHIPSFLQLMVTTMRLRHFKKYMFYVNHHLEPQLNQEISIIYYFVQVVAYDHYSAQSFSF